MALLLTAVSICALGGYLLWRYADRLFKTEGVHLTLRLDRPEPGAHLIWDIANTGEHPVTLTKLIVHGRGGATDTVPLGLPRVLAPQDRITLPTDGDWSLLGGKVDRRGRFDGPGASGVEAAAHCHPEAASAADRSARLQHVGARFSCRRADLAFGVVILGLGFFMLMWVIATG